MKKFFKKLICLSLSVMLIFSFVGMTTVSAAEIIYGDLNDDGVVDMKDYLMLRKRVAGLLNNSQINRLNADINGDGKILASDVAMLAQHLVNQRTLGKSVGYTMDELSSSMNLIGRAVLDGDKVLLSQTASGIKFAINCDQDLSGNLVINMETADYAMVDIIVDDKYDDENIYTIEKLRKTTVKYTQPLSLTKGEHTITILKATEWLNDNLITINSVMLFGELVTQKPAARPYRIEFYGDSITSGYGNCNLDKGGSYGAYDCQDGGQTYATFLSNSLNADWSIASASGHGVLGGYNNTTSTYDKFFDYSVVNPSDPTLNQKWSSKDFDADLVIINFGTNDDSRIKNAGATLDTDAYVAECGKIINNIRANNADAKILWVIGMNYVRDDSQVVSALKTVADVYNIDFYKMPAASSGGDGHPTIAEHKTHAKRLESKIRELYPDLFK